MQTVAYDVDRSDGRSRRLAVPEVGEARAACLAETVSPGETAPDADRALRPGVLSASQSVRLMPMSVAYLPNSVTGSSGETWEIYYGIVNTDDAAGVRDLGTGKAAPPIDGRYFILVERQTTNCGSCGQSLRAINATGKVLSANYGLKRSPTTDCRPDVTAGSWGPNQAAAWIEIRQSHQHHRI